MYLVYERKLTNYKNHIYIYIYKSSSLVLVLFYDGQKRGRKILSVGIFLRKLKPYLHKEIQDSQKTTENCAWLDRRARLGWSPAPPVHEIKNRTSPPLVGHHHRNLDLNFMSCYYRFGAHKGTSSSASVAALPKVWVRSGRLGISRMVQFVECCHAVPLTRVRVLAWMFF